MQTKRRAYLLLIASMVSWGFANPLSDIAMDYFTPGHMVVVEVGAGAIVLSIIGIARRMKLQISWKWALIFGALEPGLTYLFGNIGYATGTVVTGLIIMSSEVLMLAVLGRLILHEKITPTEGLAIVVGVSGAILVGWAATNDGVGNVWSGFAFAMAALCAAGYAIAVRFFSTKYPTADSFAITWGQTLVALALGIITLPVTLAIPGDGLALSAIPAVGWLAAVGAGIFGVAIPFVLFAQAANQVPSRHAAIALNVIPVVGITLGAVLGRGLPTPMQYVGGALVLASLAAMTKFDHHNH